MFFPFFTIFIANMLCVSMKTLLRWLLQFLRFPKCFSMFLCLCVPLCAVLIRGMLIIVWPHGSHSSLGEGAETGEGCWDVGQHPALSHLSCHLCYASHGIACVGNERQSRVLIQLNHTSFLFCWFALIWIKCRQTKQFHRTTSDIHPNQREDGKMHHAEREIPDHRCLFIAARLFTALFTQGCV